MPMAFTRAVSPRLADCALTHLKRHPIDVRRASEQQAAYERALADAGLTIHRLEPLDDHPDGVFVEDTAVLLGDHAVIARPGIPSRFDEIFSTAEGLAPYFKIHFLDSGILDGGDVLRIDKMLYVGRSRRTDSQGMSSLKEVAEKLGFQVSPVELGRCLHLKTAATFAGPDQHGRPTVLVNPEWVDPAIFAGTDPIHVGERRTLRGKYRARCRPDLDGRGQSEDRWNGCGNAGSWSSNWICRNCRRPRPAEPA